MVRLIFFLIDHGARIDHQDMDGLTPLMWAALAGNGTTERSLLRRGANFDIRDKLNETALDKAREGPSEECVTLLKQATRSRDAARRVERR
jgi:ankyrin repeat protein